MRSVQLLLRPAVLLLAGALWHVAAHAETLIGLNYERTALGMTTYSSVASPLMVPGTYTYGHSVPHADGVVSGTSHGFYDDHIFTIGTGQIDSVTSTIDLAHLLGISDLQVRLFNVTDASTPGTTGDPGPSLIEAWSYMVSCGTGCTGTVDVITPHALAAGTYDLQILGTTEVLGGSYSGVLNTTPVPVPAAFPLLLSGIGALGGVLRRRI